MGGAGEELITTLCALYFFIKWKSGKKEEEKKIMADFAQRSIKVSLVFLM